MTSSDTERNEFAPLMRQRKQDHINWLDELYRSVEEERAFTLATDPQQCAFGRWYDSYQTDNTQLAFHLKRFDAPHRRIHGIAQRIGELVDEGLKEEAKALVKQTRDTDLAQMIQLFDEVSVILSAAREVVLVMLFDGERCGFLVDEVRVVRGIAADQIQSVDNHVGLQNVLTTGIADVGGVTTLLLDERELASAIHAA